MQYKIVLILLLGIIDISAMDSFDRGRITRGFEGIQHEISNARQNELQSDLALLTQLADSTKSMEQEIQSQRTQITEIQETLPAIQKILPVIQATHQQNENILNRLEKMGDTLNQISTNITIPTENRDKQSSLPSSNSPSRTLQNHNSLEFEQIHNKLKEMCTNMGILSQNQLKLEQQLHAQQQAIMTALPSPPHATSTTPTQPPVTFSE